jgi:transposase
MSQNMTSATWGDKFQVLTSQLLLSWIIVDSKEIFSSHPMTLFNPPIFQFYPCTKTSERVFRSFSSSNSSKTSENTFRSSYSRQKKFGKRVPKFKTRGKNGNPRGKKSHGGWEEKISIQNINSIAYVNSRYVITRLLSSIPPFTNYYFYIDKENKKTKETRLHCETLFKLSAMKMQFSSNF